MSMITEQVKRLRNAANRFDAEGLEPSDGDLMREAADIIDAYKKTFEDIRAEFIRWIEMDGGSYEYYKALKRGLNIVNKFNLDKVGKERE